MDMESCLPPHWGEVPPCGYAEGQRAEENGPAAPDTGAADQGSNGWVEHSQTLGLCTLFASLSVDSILWEP